MLLGQIKIFFVVWFGANPAMLRDYFWLHSGINPGRALGNIWSAGEPRLAVGKASVLSNIGPEIENLGVNICTNRKVHW